MLPPIFKEEPPSFGADLFQIGSALLEGLAGAQRSRRQEQENLFNALTLQQNADSERVWAAAEIVRMRRAEQQRMGKNLASAGASGVVAGTGSFLDLAADDSAEALLDQQITRARAEQRARAYEASATLQRFAARTSARNRVPSFLATTAGKLAPIFTRTL